MAVMMSPRDNWTDERLDDLSKKVDDGFTRVDTDIRDLRREINARFDAMNRNFLAGLVAVVATILGSTAF